MSATVKSFCVGPHFRTILVNSGRHSVTVGRECVGFIREVSSRLSSAGPLKTVYVVESDGSEHASLRQAGVRCLQIACVKGPLEASS